MKSDLLAGLNAEQRCAVTWPACSALILAGAGSGKTRVLTTRIAWLLQTGQASPASILAVTFTNKAAREMQARLIAMVPINVRAMWMGTFHGLCHRFLRAHYRDAGLPATFTILDSQDQLSAIKRLLKGLALSDEIFPPKIVQNFINHHKEAGQRAHALSPYDHHTRKLVELYACYDTQCHQEGVVDFAELLLRSYELLSSHGPLREHYQSRFHFILVDEFQDTNPLQYAWLKLLAGTNHSLFAVGDDDQSIYAFRGAEVGNMQALLRDFGIAEPVRLEQNYRSMGNILQAANAIIEHNEGRLGKRLWTQAGEGELIRVYEAGSDTDEAHYIAAHVKALKQEGSRLSDMAVLYRSNAQSRVLEQALIHNHIPYRVYGGMRFFERQEVKHALAYLRLLINPHDDNAFLRVVNVPLRGIGVRTIENLQRVAGEQHVSLWQAVSLIAESRAAAHLVKFIALVNTMREQCVELSLGEMVECIIEGSGLRDLYEKDKKEGEERLANLNELISAAASFQPDVSEDAALEFLTAASLEAREYQAEAGEEALTLMTIHAAKGLEFDVIFVSGLEEGIFPHENCFNEKRGLEEERRLMYVAMTRACKRLYLTFAQVRMLHGLSRYLIRSRFIDEIPDTLLQIISSNRKLGLSEVTRKVASTRITTDAARGMLFYGFCVGQVVTHHTFGSGVVLASEGSGQNVRVQVNFSDKGVKWLDLRFTELLPS